MKASLAYIFAATIAVMLVGGSAVFVAYDELVLKRDAKTQVRQRATRYRGRSNPVYGFRWRLVTADPRKARGIYGRYPRGNGRWGAVRRKRATRSYFSSRAARKAYRTRERQRRERMRKKYNMKPGKPYELKVKPEVYGPVK